MRSDHTSPRGAGAGLCKALKDMKSKVATHTGMSLSFVELVATSPVVGLLPALPPSPRSPSALLHRRMHLHSNYSFVARRSSSTEQSVCADTVNTGSQSQCNIELEAAQSLCTTAVVDGDTGPGIKASCVSPMLCDVLHSCQVRHVSCENPSCNLACGYPLSSSCACNLTCGYQSSSSSSCNLSSCVLLCWDPSSASTHPSSSSTYHAREHPLSSSSTGNLPCSFPSSPSSTCNFSSRHPSLSSITCNSLSSSTCNSPYGHPSLTSSCELSCRQSSSSTDLSYGHHLALSSLSLSTSSSTSLSSACDLFSGHSSSSSSHSYAPAKLVSDMDMSPSNKLSSENVDRCNTFCSSSTSICNHATTVLQVKSQIPSTSARVLYYIVTLIFALSSISKSFYKPCMWVSRCVVYSGTVLHYIRVMISARSVETKSDELLRVEDGGRCNEMEGLNADVSVGQQSSHFSKTSCMKRSKVLKSKLRSSFKSLSVQVPRKAFAPLHFNAFPYYSSSSPLSSSSTSSLPLSSKSPAVNNSPTGRKTRTLKSPAFARKLTKSFNQRRPLAVSQISPVSPGSHMQGMVYSHPSSYEGKEHNPNRATSLNRSGGSVMVPLIATPLALCALFYGKVVAFIAVTAWLVAVSIASSICCLWRTPFQICSLQSH